MRGLLFLMLICSFSLSAQVNVDSIIRETRLRIELEQRNLIGQAYPDFNVTSICGKEISQKDLIDKVTIINFWFVTCAPCVAEFDALNDLYEKYKGKPEFQFLSFCRDSESSIKESVEEHKLPYPIYSMKDEECRRLKCMAYPTTLIIDKEGKVAYIKSGGSINKEDAYKQVGLFEDMIVELLSKF